MPMKLPNQHWEAKFSKRHSISKIAHICRRASFFQEIERFFISILVKELMNGHYQVGKHNFSSMQAAMKKLNDVFETSFNIGFCFERFFLLRERYNLFRWITRLSGVQHEPITNHIQSSDDAWEFICEKEPLARAYMLHGEKMFDGLKLLFQEGPDSPEFMVNVDEVEVIDLSSDQEDGTGGIAVNGKGKEVAEPVNGHKGKAAMVIGKEGEPD